MTMIDVGFIVAALAVCLIASSVRNWRGIMWIGVGALSYINAAIAWRMSLPYAEAITGTGDAAVCLAVYFWGRQRWELWIWRLFQVSVAVSLFYLAGNLGVFVKIPHDIYSVLMESINWLLLLLIGGMSVMQLVGAANDVGALRPWNRIRAFTLSLRQERKTPPFHRAS